VQRHPEYTRSRIQQLADRMREKIYAHRQPVQALEVAGPVERISYGDAQKLKGFRPAKIGDQLGPLWATYWYRASARVPRDFAGHRVDLHWASHSEATLWMNGKTIQGLNFEPHSYDRAVRADAVLMPKAKGGEKISFQVEVACNSAFGDPGKRGPYSKDAVSPFVFEACELRAFDQWAAQIYYDYSVLVDLEAEHDKGLDPTRGGELLFELNRFANVYDENDRNTWKAAHDLLKPLYSRKNGSQVHELSAIGHAHIDTAWLWPLAETWRKCDRTFSSQTTYMDDYPEYKFACSQAYQYDIVRQRNGDLYKRIKERAKRGQWIPVGGTWIEPDCNIPSGESLVRQFLLGQRYFQKEFGRRCKEFWNPDVFGYNGQLPQIMRGAGIKRFLTQKLSWNKFTKPMHHTFTWQGIDGSEVIAHFPPADTYNANASVKEIRHNVANYKDHDRSRHSYYLFGYGDGGGGPTRQMLENLRRMKDTQGLPRVTMRSSDAFFKKLEDDCSHLPTTVGELYFELHRGTYTTQAATKRGNRKSEILLHDVEFLQALKWRLARAASPSMRAEIKSAYPHDAIDELWKIVLLNQFHDILPGSSITLVYDDAANHYAQVDSAARELRGQAIRDLFELVDAYKDKAYESGKITPINTTGFPRKEVVLTPDKQLVLADLPSCGFGEIVESHDRVQFTTSGGGWTIENGQLRAHVSKSGHITSLIEKSTGRESLAGDGNVFQLFDDRPTAWDAWDVDPSHLETARDCGPATTARVATQSPLRVEIVFEHTIGKATTLTQTIRLDAHARRIEIHCKVDWREDHKFLKVAFPVNARAMNATYEMQFGSVERPTHFNAPADLAKFEVPLHRWFDLSEHGFGVSILSESKYGASTLGNIMRLSLLRAPTSPDPKADRGEHAFAYAIFPHAGGWRDAGTVAEAAAFNIPLLWAPGAAPRRSMASVDQPGLVIDTVKKAEDSDEIIVRLYEAHGGRGTARLSLGFPFKSARFCNLLEDNGHAAVVTNGKIALPYTPYQVLSLKVR